MSIRKSFSYIVYLFFDFFLIQGHVQTAEYERIAIQFFQLREYDKAEILLESRSDQIS